MAAELYIGKVCAKHPELGGQRYASCQKCFLCARENTKTWHAANPERRKEWSKTNTEKVNGYAKTWRDANPEKVKTSSKVRWVKNPEKEKLRSATWQKANPEKANAASRKAKRKSAYGITEAQYQALIVSQNNCCLICKTPAGEHTLHIDHCHVSGKIRGLLCGKCNKALGLLGDNVEVLKAAIKYLRKHNK